MGFKSIAKMVRKGSVSPPSETEVQQTNMKQQEKMQKQQDKRVSRENGKRVLPTNPEQEAEYRELSSRMWAIEKGMQDARAEVMKPRMKEDVLESRSSMSSFQREPLFLPDRLSSPSSAGSTPPNHSPAPLAAAPEPALPPARAVQAEPSYFPSLPAAPPSMPVAQHPRTPSPLSQTHSASSGGSKYPLYQPQHGSRHERRASGLRNQHFPEVCAQ